MPINPTLLRSGIEIANQITKSFGLQSQVSYRRMTGSDATGPTYASAVPLDAILDDRKRQSRTPDGTVIVVNAPMTFIDIAQLVAATGGAGFTVDDLFTLPDGASGPVASLGGFVDAGTGHPIATEVTLG